MKRFFKWLGLILASLAGLIVLAGLVMFLSGNSRLNKTYDFPLSTVVVPTDEASIDYGKHRVQTLCADCHGADLGGVLNWLDVGPLGRIDSANLTSGEGGVGQQFSSDEDYVRALRHGIDPDGKPINMPAVRPTAYFEIRSCCSLPQWSG
ncbi:MAG: c-type cytochrome [Syntrophothermus sp.]